MAKDYWIKAGRSELVCMDKGLHHLRDPRRMVPPVNTKKWLLMASKWCEMDFATTHTMTNDTGSCVRKTSHLVSADARHVGFFAGSWHLATVAFPWSGTRWAKPPHFMVVVVKHFTSLLIVV